MDGGQRPGRPTSIVLFLGGDVMTGRGIDRVLPHPGDPRLYEPYARSAEVYVEAARRAGAAIPRPAGFAYPWGEALEELERIGPDLRIINLETAVTGGGAPWKGKAIHYRMHPRNFPCILAAGIDCCCLANNHVLDWDRAGLEETLRTIRQAGLRCAGAGMDLEEAEAPAVLPAGGGGRVIVFSFGEPGSGIPPSWQAGPGRPGVFLIEELTADSARRIGGQVRRVKRPGDIAVASIHWGGNWGYSIPRGQRRFAHALIEEAGIDLIHGHSSHHVKAIEVYRGRLILYGCGDLLNDYEGIGGYESYQPGLALLYFPEMDPAGGGLRRLRLSPMRRRDFRLRRASRREAERLGGLLTREGRRFGTGAVLQPDGTLSLEWG
jgi:poly-gamma-glutamate synthesis protein (capsule biosynthesis protein)